MKWSFKSLAGFWRLVPVLAVLLLAVGCQTTPKIDWAGRVGSYTYDQAVLDFGPPDRYARLTDDTVVAEWLTRRGYARTYVSSGYWYPGCLSFPTYMDSYAPDYYLRLTFGPDGRLKAWKKFAK